MEGLGVIRQSGDHLLMLITEILDLAKVEAGKMELVPIDIRFPDFLEGIAGIVRTNAMQKSLEFTLAKTSALPEVVLADEVRLRQILLNLLSNAVKFTNTGEVTLRIRTVDSEKKGRKTFNFEVTDTGIGIPESELEKVFLPFEQIRERSLQIEGTGLGLAITKQLVTLMGGEIEVDSQVGKGSTFRFEVSFPVVLAEPEKKSDERDVTGYEGERRKILVVDDNRNSLLMLLNMLEPLGFAVTTAENGEEAVKKASASYPDLILMDLRMPKMDGFEATRAIQKVPQLRNTPIIAVSATVMEADRKKSKADGCVAFLPKPISEEELFALLESHLDLVWIYAELPHDAQSDKKFTGPLIPPPEEEIAVLHKLAQIGNMGDIEKQADHVAALGDQYLPFANKLRKLASDFDESAILKMVEEYLKEEP